MVFIISVVSPFKHMGYYDIFNSKIPKNKYNQENLLM